MGLKFWRLGLLEWMTILLWLLMIINIPKCVKMQTVYLKGSILLQIVAFKLVYQRIIKSSLVI